MLTNHPNKILHCKLQQFVTVKFWTCIWNFPLIDVNRWPISCESLILRGNLNQTLSNLIWSHLNIIQSHEATNCFTQERPYRRNCLFIVSHRIFWPDNRSATKKNSFLYIWRLHLENVIYKTACYGGIHISLQLTNTALLFATVCLLHWQHLNTFTVLASLTRPVSFSIITSLHRFLFLSSSTIYVIKLSNFLNC